MSLAQKTLSGFIWTFTSRIGTRFSIFAVSIVLARLLTPADFGLIAMLSIFFAISSSLVDSGFTQALIRQEIISEVDKSTVFYINLIVSIIIYVLLWFSSPFIATFFNQPQLLWLARVMGIEIILNALIIVQRAVLTQSLRFKLLSSIDIGVSILTGCVAIALAYSGTGVWALAIKYFMSSFFVTIIFFIINPWLPTSFINKQSFTRLFGFGSKLMITGLINKFYNNIYNLTIGKLFSAETLGYYDRANLLVNQSITTISIALAQVTYPILSKTKDDNIRLKEAHKKIINVVTFINIPISVILFFSAKPLVLVLLGANWEGAIPFVKLMSLSALVKHLIDINKNLLNVIGRSDLFLKTSLISKIFTTIAVIIGLQFGIWGLVISSVLATYIEVFVVMFFVSRFFNYRISEQFINILNIYLLIIPVVVFLIVAGDIAIDSNILQLLFIVISVAIIYYGTAYLFNSIAILQIKEVIIPFVKRKYKV
jgi:O-antigen/teichoic acid export membrane protein